MVYWTYVDIVGLELLEEHDAGGGGDQVLVGQDHSLQIYIIYTIPVMWIRIMGERLDLDPGGKKSSKM